MDDLTIRLLRKFYPVKGLEHIQPIHSPNQIRTPEKLIPGRSYHLVERGASFQVEIIEVDSSKEYFIFKRLNSRRNEPTKVSMAEYGITPYRDNANKTRWNIVNHVLYFAEENPNEEKTE